MGRRDKSHVTFQKALLRWFRANRRAYPWRRNRNPYRVWLAEVMLQQTRIAAVIPYYEKFLRRFPNIESLAGAPEREVLQYWAGLGYYSRARNLRRAARQIVARHRGKFPRTMEEAIALPGIGRYTAAAILSIAHGAPLAALDGNVARVLARVGAVRGDLRAPQRWRRLEATAQEFLPIESAGDWNQALMELGEIICTPRSPRCSECPVRTWCESRKRGLVEVIPTPRAKPATVHQRIAAAVLLDSRRRTLLVRDPGAHDDVLFSRMWQFPAVEASRDAASELTRHLRDRYGIDPSALSELAPARHSVTYRNITLAPFLARVDELPPIPRSRRVPLSDIGRVPLSSATRKIAESAQRAIDSDETACAAPQNDSRSRVLN